METVRILYRKLAMKSTLKFGKFAEQTVEKLITLGQTEYLRWVYYNMSNIDFLPEVKTAIGIEKEIEKPGKDTTYWEIYKKAQNELFKSRKPILKDWSLLTDEEKLECFKRSAVKKKRTRIRRERAERQLKRAEYNRELTPAQLQGINHGHGTGYKRRLPKEF